MTPNSSPARVATGIAGLDDVLQGGLPQSRIYLVKGDPGVGKTTLALQFILNGVNAGERGLYITLSETVSELQDVASSHGWSLDGVSLYEFNAQEHERAESEYTMYHPAEIELHEVMEALLAEVDRLQPTRVVFDSLSEVRLLAQEGLRYRRQILALKRRFIGKNCTVLLLDDHSADADNHLESLVHGVIALERQAPIYGGVRRRLEVVKLRGVRFRDGFHDYTIEPGGIQLYPRLIAAEHRPPIEAGNLMSGVPELDALIGGGLPRGSSTLVLGPAGSGKSALSAQFAASATRAGQQAVIFTFDESVSTALARADALGVSLRASVDSGTLRIIQVDPAEKSPGQFAHEVRMAVERDHAQLVVIDSLTGYMNAMPEERFLLNQLHELLTYLGQLGVVTILTSTQHGLFGTNMATPVDVSYLADSVIMLRFFETAGSVHTAISVVKKRTGEHEKFLREYLLDSTGIHIGAPLRNFQGVLSGTPSYLGAPEPMLGDANDERS